MRDAPADETPPSCRCCGSRGLTRFHRVDEVPVYANHLAASPDEARAMPVGALRLDFCGACGFVQNSAFAAGRVDYTASYEDSQAHSPRFQRFARELAEALAARHGLRGRTVLEIGCGQGDFLALLCEVGEARGVGIDPSFRPGRLGGEVLGRIRFLKEFWGPGHGVHGADLVVCRHTLEHLPEPRAFVADLRAALEETPGSAVFFEVPDVTRVLDEGAFWDLYYEHCAYFSPGSLARLFRACGFEVRELRRGFADQYLLLEARPAPPQGPAGRALALEEPPEALRRSVERFAAECGETLRAWRARLVAARARGGRVVLWGGGSKAVGFLCALGLRDEVAAVVDVNPHKQGRFLPRSAHRIVAPAALKGEPPDLVVVMNPIYRDEIRAELQGLGLAPEVVAL